MPSDFSQTPDQFLQQQPNVQGYPAQIPVQGDQFLQQPAQVNSYPEPIPAQGDQFLSQAPAMPQLPVQTPVAKYKSYLDNARNTHASIRTQLDQRHAAQRQAIDSQVAKITQANTLLNSTPASTLGMSDQQLS